MTHSHEMWITTMDFLCIQIAENLNPVYSKSWDKRFDRVIEGVNLTDLTVDVLEIPNRFLSIILTDYLAFSPHARLLNLNLCEVAEDNLSQKFIQEFSAEDAKNGNLAVPLYIAYGKTAARNALRFIVFGKPDVLIDFVDAAVIAILEHQGLIENDQRKTMSEDLYFQFAQTLFHLFQSHKLPSGGFKCPTTN